MTDKLNLLRSVKRELRAVLLSTGEHHTTYQVERDYLRLIGQPIPCRPLGYAVPEDLLLDIPDVAEATRDAGGRLRFRGVPDETTVHIAELVAKNKPKETYAGRVDDRRGFGGGGVRCGGDGEEGGVGNGFDSRGGVVQLPMAPDAVFRRQVTELLTSYPDGIRCSEFSDSFARRFGHYVDAGRMRFRGGIVELLRSMEDLVRVEEPGHSDDMIVRKRTGAVSSRISNGKTLSAIDEQLRRDIRKVLILHPDGIKASKFGSEYQRVIGRPLALRFLGYTTIIDLMADLSDIVSRERPSTGDWVLRDICSMHRATANHAQTQNGSNGYVHCDPDHPTSSQLSGPAAAAAAAVAAAAAETVDQNILSDAIAVALHLSPYRNNINLSPKSSREEEEDTTYILAARSDCAIPEDCVEPGESYAPPVWSPQAPGGYIGARVSAVRSPGEFWIRFDGTSLALNRLRDEMRSVYNSAAAANRLALPQPLVRVGQVCAALCVVGGGVDGSLDWRRCSIRAINGAIVQLYEVDFGSMSFTHVSSLRRLGRQFLSLPAQAQQARLAYLRPANESWTQASTDCFKRLVSSDRLVFVQVVGSDEGDVMSVLLCDTSGECDVHINDCMLREGHAAYHADDVGQRNGH